MSRRRKGGGGHKADEGLPNVSRDKFTGMDGNLKGLIVDEDGLDVVYWRMLHGIKNPSPRQRSSFKKSEVVDVASPRDRAEQGAEEVALLAGKSSASEHKSSAIWPELSLPSPELAIPAGNNNAAAESQDPIPPPQPAQQPKPAGTAATLKLPPPPVPETASNQAEGSASGHGGSLAWNDIEEGSFKADDDFMEALFGYVATKRKTPRPSNNSPSPGNLSPGQTGRIFILDKQKSHDIAIVLKSLSVSRRDILNALSKGRGLDSDALEKLTGIAPTSEEQSRILAFSGDPTRLADTESFLFHIIKSVPSAFSRFTVMLFKLNYESEVSRLRESVTAVELGCKELRGRGLLVKLLEAILKAGNRMTAGKAGDFSLGALKKLSSVKSTDGKTTLLRFVVEEVVRSEGRRLAVNRSRTVSQSEINPESKDDSERDYVMLGLPLVEGLSAEFSNTKKAAVIECESFAGSVRALQARVSETRQLIAQCDEDGGCGRFVKEMRGFLESAEPELALLKKDEASAVELVKATSKYYRAGDSGEKGSNPIELFVILRDFLGMVDQVCIEIARDMQRKNPADLAGAVTSSSPDLSRKTMRFPKLPPDFFSDE